MNSSSFPLPIKDGTLRIDGSALGDMLTCPVYYGYKQACRRVPVGEKDALVFGGAGHAGLAAWHRGQSLEQAIEAACAHFESHPCELGYRTPERMCKVLEAYAENYPREKENYQVLAVEQPFEHKLGFVDWPETLDLPGFGGPLGQIQVLWQGRRDLRYQLAKTGEVVLRDTKFTSRDDGGYQDAFLLSMAMRGYVWADRQEGILTVGCELEQVIVRDELKRASKYGNKAREEFKRWPVIYYSEQQLADWKHTVLAWVQTWLDWHAQGWIPENASQCSRFGRPCEYLGVCTVPEDQRATMLAMDIYKDYTWSPLDSD